MKSKIETEAQQEQLPYITISPYEIDPDVTGKNCPVCNYPTVYESGVEVCYNCGWTEDAAFIESIQEDDTDEEIY